MYEQFTDRARNVMNLANREARRFNHEYIGTEHILLGLAREDSGVACQVLLNLTIDPQRIAIEVGKLVQSGPDMVSIGKLPMTPAAKRAIEYAKEESWRLKHKQVDTEHLLLGLLREDGGVASAILANVGLRVDEARREIERILFQQSVDSGQDSAGKGVVELPWACPKCGHTPVVRVIWGCVRLLGQNLEDVKRGQAILGSYRSGEEGPLWVCLQCAPRWSEVHRLVMQDYELQIEKEDAIVATDFDKAAQCRDMQTEARRRLILLLDELLRNPEN